MWKIFLYVGCFLVTSCSMFIEEERFVNPVFYETMDGKWGSAMLKLTPTSYYECNKYGYCGGASCQLLENAMDKITLKCLFMPPDPNNENELEFLDPDDEPTYWVKSFKILAQKLEYEEGILIEELSYYKGLKIYRARSEHIVYTLGD